MKGANRNKVLLLLAAIVIASCVWIASLRKPEDYEGESGPSPSDDPELPKMTQAELDAVMKFIRKTD
jgi:hypothetical protein